MAGRTLGMVAVLASCLALADGAASQGITERGGELSAKPGVARDRGGPGSTGARELESRYVEQVASLGAARSRAEWARIKIDLVQTYRKLTSAAGGRTPRGLPTPDSLAAFKDRTKATPGRPAVADPGGPQGFNPQPEPPGKPGPHRPAGSLAPEQKPAPRAGNPGVIQGFNPQPEPPGKARKGARKKKKARY